MEKINIANLLKDCPTGMELDSTLYYNVFFDKICEDDDCLYPIRCYTIEDGIRNSVDFTKYGEFHTLKTSKCVIFPKGKTTWEGFQISFKDGDVVATSSGAWIGITTGGKKGEFMPVYCVIKCDGAFEAYLDIKKELSFSRFATKEERQKLFDEIKAHGYIWNSETKTLEKLFPYNIGTKVWVKSDKEHKYIHTIVGISYNCFGNLEYEIKDEKTGIVVHYSKELLIPITKEPKFKVGAIIQDKTGYKVRITEVNIEDECYGYESLIAKGIGGIAFREQDNWELVPYKFDINTLIPFESKVLVRHNKNNKWTGSFFSFIDRDLHSYCYKFVTTAGKSYPMMIPFKGNQHLLGKTDDCKDFYKTWE